MDLLQRRIASEWYDIRNLPARFFAVHERLPLGPATLAALADDLAGAAAEGIVACKRVLLGPVFFALEEVRYQTLAAAQLTEHAAAARRALFLILLQRIVLREPRRHSEPPVTHVPPSAADLDLAAIVADVRRRVDAEPAFRNHPAAKSILLQVKQYQREREKLRELTAQVSNEQRQRIQAGFGPTFKRIVDTLRKSYSTILAADLTRVQAEGADADHGPLLTRLEVARALPALERQAEICSRVHSTLSFAAAERYKTRQVLLGLSREQGELDRLLDEESACYLELTGDREARARLEREQVRAIVRGMQRHIIGAKNGAGTEPRSADAHRGGQPS